MYDLRDGGASPGTGLTRAQFLKHSAALAGGAVAWKLLGGSREALAFPPDWLDEGFTRMCYHENPVGPSSLVFQRIEEFLARDAGRSVGRFPDDVYSDLKNAILRYNDVEEQLDVDNVEVTVGSTEALMMCALALLSPERSVLTEWPTYGIFFGRAQQMGSPVIKVGLQRQPDGRYLPDLPAMRAALAADPGIKLVHFNVINNPMGSYLGKKDFDDFVLHVQGNYPEVVIIADDSDPEFRERTASDDFPRPIEHVVAGRNLIHIQTFSHIFGMTGLRLGYVIAPHHLAQALREKRISHGVSVPAMIGGLASLEDAGAQIERSYQNNHTGRLWLYEQFDALGLEYLRSHGAYIMVDMRTESSLIYILMAAQRVLIRQGSEWDHPTWIRVNPGRHPDENEIFIKALKQALCESQLYRDVRDLLGTEQGVQGARIGWQHGFLPLDAKLTSADYSKLLGLLA